MKNRLTYHVWWLTKLLIVVLILELFAFMALGAGMSEAWGGIFFIPILAAGAIWRHFRGDVEYS